MLKDPNAIKLIVTFGLIFGTVNTYGTVIGIMTAPLGYTDTDSSLFGAIFIVGGIVGSGVLGAYVEITKQYKRALLIVSIIACLTPFLLMYTLSTEVIWLCCISIFLMGLDLAILPIGIDFGVELTFPVEEAISTGLLMSASQLVSIVTTYSVSGILNATDGKKGSYFA